MVLTVFGLCLLLLLCLMQASVCVLAKNPLEALEEEEVDVFKGINQK